MMKFRTVVVLGFLTCVFTRVFAQDDMKPCDVTEFGCCPDGVTAANDEMHWNCPIGKFLFLPGFQHQF